MKLSTIILLLLSCLYLHAQPINSEFIPDGKSPKLLGKVNKVGLSSGSYGAWFNKNYDAYEPNTQILDSIGNDLNPYRIEMFLGTWCGDSKREVPKFYRILEALDFPMERLTTIAVDNVSSAYKQSPGGEHEGKNIHRVPTFIFYRNGKEVNRITERPVKSLEEDILQILLGDYTPNYSGVSTVNTKISELGVDKFDNNSRTLVPELSKVIDSRYELNTYAKMIFTSGMQERAISVFRLNTFLFPEEVATHLSLANTLGATGHYSEAIAAYKKALSVDPENEEARESLEYVMSKISN